MSTEREADTVTQHLDAWAARFREEAAYHDRQAAEAEDPYLKGVAAGLRTAGWNLQAASTDIKYRRRDGFKLRAL